MTLRKMMRPIIGSVFALLALGFSQVLMGQTVNGTLLGTVADSTGATIANAQVTVTLTSTGAMHVAETNGSGNYTFPGLQPGVYTITIDAKGFKKAEQQNINLLANTSPRVDVILQPGNVSETVVVTTAPPVLQTDRADISTKIEAQSVMELPLTTNRNFQSLLNLVPGTAPAVFQHSQFFNPQDSLQTEANGFPRLGNLYQIEGIDDDERTGLLQILIPPAEAIQSVDISTNNFEAELGRAVGAVTNVTLKSGTNAFHGSAFEFVQNNDLDARSYFGGPLGHLSYNYFGGAVGGPIVKDKLFFFADYLRTLDHEATSNTFTIPDARYYTANSSGNIDLSAALVTNSKGQTVGQIYDPATGDGRTVAQGGTPRTPFPNNQIPLNRVNPVSLTALKDINAAAAKYGTLDSTKPLSGPTNNYVTNLPFTKTADSFDTKIDYTPTEKNHISGRMSWQRTNTFQSSAFAAFIGGPAAGGFEGAGTQTSYSAGGNYDHVFSPTFFTEARIGVAHLRNSASPNDYGTTDATTLGVPGVNISGQPFTAGQVGITINGGFSNPIVGYSASLPWIRAESNIDMVNNWTKVKGNHTFKFGADLRRVRDDLLQDQTYSPRGAFTFSANQTSDTAAGGLTNTVNDVASFLLDQPSGVGRDLNTFFPAYRQWWFFAFGGDKWQATPKMTVDLGLRWEFYPPATPRHSGGFSNYNPVNNTLVLAGLGNNPSNLGMKTQYRYFAPRTGISYRLANDTVLRAGFGVSYTPFPDNTYAFNYPVRANNSYTPVGASSFTPAVLSDGVTVATFQAGFPAPVPVTIPSSGIIPANTSQLTSQVYTYIPLNYKNPYAMSWNVALQQAFLTNYSLQIAYVANHGVDIDSSQNINLPSTYGGGNASDPEDCVGCSTAFGRTAATNQFFLGFSSNYESLQVQLTKRLSNGFAFTSAFTWGKELGYFGGDDGGLRFFINWRRNYAPADYDRAKNFEQSFTYELPFGHGHAYLNSGVGDVVLGGWKLTGIVSIVSGTPFTVGANGSSPLNTPGTSQDANITGSLRVLHHIGRGNQWFDPSNFSQPSGCTANPCTAANVGLGNTGRNQFRGPGYLQDNLSLFKTFHLIREMSLETRIDATQLSNTPQFNNPDSGNITDSNFGQITGTLGSGQGAVNGIGGGRSLQGSVRITF
ncbi:MAG TPA: carboxypeptidase regulatory-like domain-containing protein [Terracidiphilus sp.]|nr:carboxypeptidase regulatory-like domain-containing protein [Terracidiphilus sp.]